MDKIPQFCENMHFKKIIWEELHKQEGHLRKRTQNQAHGMARLSTIIAHNVAPAPLSIQENIDAEYWDK